MISTSIKETESCQGKKATGYYPKGTQEKACEKKPELSLFTETIGSLADCQ